MGRDAKRRQSDEPSHSEGRGGVGDRLHRTWVPDAGGLNTGAFETGINGRVLVERVVFIIRTQPEIDERLLQHGHDCPP